MAATSSFSALAAASALAPPPQLAWNATFEAVAQGDGLIDLQFGWGRIYVSLDSHAVFLDNVTGHALNAEPRPDYSCYVWTSRAFVQPLRAQPGMAVVAGNRTVTAFNGTDYEDGAAVAWRSPAFDCPYLEGVTSQVVVVNNFTVFGFVDVADGSMWTLNYTTLDQQSSVTDNLYLIEPPDSPPRGNHPALAGHGETYALVTDWGDNKEDVTTTLYNAVTGKEVWRNSSQTVSWFTYYRAGDILIENNLPDLLRAREWRNWDTAPLWSVPESVVEQDFQALVTTDQGGGLVVLFGDSLGGMAALDVMSGEHKWTVKGTAASSKSAQVAFLSSQAQGGDEYFFHAYSIFASVEEAANVASWSAAPKLRHGDRNASMHASDYAPITVEKRSLKDGSLVWKKERVAHVKYGWFEMEVSVDGSLVYLWPGVEGAWVAALDASD